MSTMFSDFNVERLTRLYCTDGSIKCLAPMFGKALRLQILESSEDPDFLHEPYDRLLDAINQTQRFKSDFQVPKGRNYSNLWL